MEEYIRLRDEAVLECNIEKLEKLMKKYNPEMYPKFKNSNEIVKLATIHKMACAITTMPKKRVEQAKKWLNEHGMREEIW
jgi:hypothetical protein